MKFTLLKTEIKKETQMLIAQKGKLKSNISVVNKTVYTPIVYEVS